MATPSNFAEKVAASARHPVLLFGTGESGKSTLLISLLRCLAHNREQINMSFGDRIFDRNDEDAERLHQQAREFYERYARLFGDGVQLPATYADKPFFVPIDVRPPDGKSPVRLAFLEGMGDWIKPLAGDTGPLFAELKPQIIDLLEHFGGPLSIIYVAPFSPSGPVQSGGESDTGLAGAISKYQDHRNLPERDCHLFVLAKWDLFAEPLKDAPLFRHVDGADVDRILMERYSEAWSQFRNLPLERPSRRRYFMQYASGHIVGGKVRQPPPQHRETFERYPKTVWNWIYANAVEAQLGAEGQPRGNREHLFAEVLPVVPPKPTAWDRLSRILVPR